MRRKEFLKQSAGMPGLVSLVPVISKCEEDVNQIAVNGDCTVTDSETDGSYPLYSSRGSSIQRVEIADGKTGIPLTMTITIKDVNNNCNAVADARVDVWHCDKDGYYSGYSNTGYLGTQDNSSSPACDR